MTGKRNERWSAWKELLLDENYLIHKMYTRLRSRLKNECLNGWFSIVVNHNFCYECDKLIQLFINLDRQRKSSVSMNFYELPLHSQCCTMENIFISYNFSWDYYDYEHTLFYKSTVVIIIIMIRKKSFRQIMIVYFIRIKNKFYKKKSAKVCMRVKKRTITWRHEKIKISA